MGHRAKRGLAKRILENIQIGPGGLYCPCCSFIRSGKRGCKKWRPRPLSKMIRSREKQGLRQQAC